MRFLINFIRTGAGALIILCMAFTGIMGQPQPDFDLPEISKITGQDSITGNQENLLIDLLNNSLHSLAENDRRGRMTGGYVLLGLGIGSGIGGAATLAFGEGDGARIAGISLLGGGALLSGLSLIPFNIRTESERLYSDFRTDLGDQPDQNRQKIYYWERRFEELAEKNRRERIISGVSSILVGGVTSLAFVEGSTAQVHTFIWPAVGGITRLITKTEVERRYETYRRAREDIFDQRTVSEVRAGVVPLPNGGIISVVQVWF
jgi:hypothetical protein